jgi:hypothetical protein
MAIKIKSQVDVPIVPAWIMNEECAKQYLFRKNMVWVPYKCTDTRAIN